MNAKPFQQATRLGQSVANDQRIRYALGAERKEIEMKITDVLSRDPEIVSGAVVFKGTRVPVEAFFENLAAGMSLAEFLDNYPTVEREQVEALLRLARHDVESHFGRAA